MPIAYAASFVVVVVPFRSSSSAAQTDGRTGLGRRREGPTTGGDDDAKIPHSSRRQRIAAAAAAVALRLEQTAVCVFPVLVSEVGGNGDTLYAMHAASADAQEEEHGIHVPFIS